LLAIGSLQATTYYVRPDGDNTSWTNLGIDAGLIITSSTPTIDGTNTYYFAKGTYTKSAVAITTGKLYGGFSGGETTIDLAARALSDKDANGIIEPWEFTNETVITGANPISGSASSSRLITVTGGEINGFTLQDQFSSNTGVITLGSVTSSPTAAMDIEANGGKMINCIVKKLKSSSSAPIMTTNQYSLIDACLIEECGSTLTSASATGAVFMNAVGGKISNSVIRNNAAVGGTGVNGAIRATSLSSSDMNAIVVNCVIHNNTSGGYGGAIRADAQSNKRGIQVVNCTIVNNKSTAATTSSVDLINSGLIVNSIVVDDPKDEIRPNNNNHYVSNNAYGSMLLSSVTAYPNTNMVSGKTATDFNFTSYSTYVGAMQPGAADFNQTTYDAIRASNFKITAKTSAAVSAIGLKSLPSSYTVGGLGVTTVNLTATIPTTDLTGKTRNTLYNFDLGAYQFSDASTRITTTNQINNSNIFAFGNEISVLNAKGLLVSVFSVTGQIIESINVTSDNLSVAVEKGIYIVKAGSQISKVIVK
jgi:predicted outer membrane repeat protein